MYPSFGLLHTIHYFIIFCKLAKTSRAYAESSFLAGLTPTPTPGFKKIGTPTPTPALGYNPDSGDSNSDSAPLVLGEQRLGHMYVKLA